MGFPTLATIVMLSCLACSCLDDLQLDNFVLGRAHEHMYTFLVMDYGAEADHYSPPFPNKLLVGQAGWNTAIEIATQGLVEAHRHNFWNMDNEKVILKLIISCEGERGYTGYRDRVGLHDIHHALAYTILTNVLLHSWHRPIPYS